MFQVPGSKCQVPGFRFQVSSSELWNRKGPTIFKNLGPGTQNPEHRREAGFTLLEVILALAILGVTFALAIELLATGVRSAKASGDYTQAVLLARQKMAEIAVTRNLEGSADGGEFEGGFRWVSEIRPLPQEEDLPAQLFQVRVRVTWPGRRAEKSLDLYTLRMAVDEKKLGHMRAVQPSARGGGGRDQ